MVNPYGRWVPDSLSPSGFRWRRHDESPATTMLPIITPATVDHGGTVEYAGRQDHALPLVDVPPRVDDWCENRAPEQLRGDDIPRSPTWPI
jgi:hypothetical protein